MQHTWLFYLLFFLFGYVTCRTFYFLNATRKSLQLLQVSQVIGLFIMVRALESYHYARDFRLAIMKENDDSDHNINAFQLRFEEEINFFKNKSISQIIECHGDFFKETVEFDDWKSAMAHLEKNKDFILNFVKRS